MRVLTQSKSEIIEFPKRIWVTTGGEKQKGIIITGKATLDPMIGEYENLNRAKEVLGEMLQKYATGESVYIMPEE